ncbi:hypothetical protein BHU24_27305 [Bacillus pseudomycoides]|uniref:hypothetical protein n=1 Tax=Bacillus pseudomycoides TaxID=64104 RepID=UPI000BF39BC3|nr:hypothetical protein [Bacillus pseudomycoides]MBD5799611.1 hypothetical protein [Bacillus pseudomycoides]PEO81539.1 hypothetical protein CN571_25940 [Bacillus pseudomycoides]PFW97414.1 hypothetical protein COL29_03715 [Bacillus pseudomycoides]PFX37903.1 hypothetical protein COL32_26460 [Bacillus pseudomycoides]
MFWLGGLTGYVAGTLVTLLVIYFGYRIGEMNKVDEEWLEKSADKEMEQLMGIRDDNRESLKNVRSKFSEYMEKKANAKE